MGLHYEAQKPLVALGHLSTAGVLTPVTLTSSYAGNFSSPIDTSHFGQMTVYFDYTTGAGGTGSSLQLLFVGSPDEADSSAGLIAIGTPTFYQQNFVAVSGGTTTHLLGEHTFVGAIAATNYKGYFYLPPAHYQMIIFAKETLVGVEPLHGTLKLRVLLSGL